VHRQLGGGFRLFVSAGAFLPPALQQAWEDMGVTVLQGYGATETGTGSCTTLEDHGLGTVGRPPLGIEMRVADDSEVQFRGATLFKPNRRELEQAMGATLDLAHPDALPMSLDKLGVDNLLLTLGADGMVLVTKDRQFTRIPTMAREVFDVSGAGDTVTAWVGTALAAGASVREAAQVANYAAGVEVGKSGVATVSPVEVLAMHEAHYDQLGKLRRGGLL
jgi:hypothetical protein